MFTKIAELPVRDQMKIISIARKNPLTWENIQIERASSDRRDDRI
ncbi:hypothetical protein [Saccharothrix xinjiangensis]|uniref:Uncharacterized protein n=1 Tax=Saccharothrix xinjiangensis TaxID=204798 RepID=A0ABV9Y3V4_9PSEU